MSNPRLAEAEHWLDWPPLPTPPRRHRAEVAVAGEALVALVLDADRDALTRLCTACTSITDHRRFRAAPKEFQLAVLVRTAIVTNWAGVGGAEEHLRSSLDLAHRAAALAPETGPWRARVHYVHGNTSLNLYLRTSAPKLLATAVEQARAAVQAANSGTRLLALCRTGLANALLTLARESDVPGMVDEAVDQAAAAVDIAGSSPMGHRFKYVLAEALSARNDRRGGLDDLDRAIRLLEEFILVPDHLMSPGTARVGKMTLSSLLRRRFLRTKVRADIDRAVDITFEAVTADLEPVPAALTNCGNVLLTRFQAYGDPVDLGGAVDFQQRADLATKPGDWQAASRHNNAGNSLAVAWQVTGNQAYGERAVAQYRTALALTGHAASERASREYNLALALQTLADATGSPEHLAEAVTLFRAAVRDGMVSAVEWALSAAQHWGRWASARQAWPEACEAYEAALTATDELFRAQVLRSDKETWLVDAQGLADEAVHALTRLGRVEAALEAAEAGRARLVSEALDLGRAELTGLAESGFRPLAETYRSAADELAGLLRHDADPQVLRLARKAVDDAVEGIRAVPGHERFLARSSSSDLLASVPEGVAVVHLACAEAGGVALVVEDGEVSSVDLGADRAAVHRRAQAMADARRGGGEWAGVLDAVGRWVWDSIVVPLLPVVRARRVVLVASGRLAMLPLHAAWRPVPGGREYWIDRCTLGYAPNTRAFTAGLSDMRDTGGHALVVAAPEPSSAFGPVTHAEEEAEAVARLHPDAEVLLGTGATRAAVLERLPGARIAHFAVHGIARPARPLTSALVLAGDEELTLADVLALPTGHAQLAVLSACDTDRPGGVLPDEVVSLPTGLLQAGYAGVLATQWPVRGETAALLTVRFHHLWHVEGHQPAEALRRAQTWLRDTSNAEKATDLTTAGDKRLARALRLRDPSERAHRHPRDWAAFSYHGT
ncbi:MULTISPECIES: CHAT domain-containing protein [Actinosynnema]|uniref:CHAT domain-containing protein n=1 Tax=Actinosynnema TaxID=40566 RepID=UPI0020A5C16B|nr:CHAT domain-containing protein [Actinosynnema pretiosum]MCP2094735.1 CHAT domain-containing protein [Actinosynnema pretiosum]